MLLDEPSLGLQPTLVKAIMDAVREINERGLAVLLIEQNVHFSVAELAEKNGMRTDEGAFTVFDLYNAEEAMLTASTFCLLPVVRVNGMPIGAGKPGPVVSQLLASWSELVGVDIVEQSISRTAARDLA